jgi:hypothetical protein
MSIISRHQKAHARAVLSVLLSLLGHHSMAHFLSYCINYFQATHQLGMQAVGLGPLHNEDLHIAFTTPVSIEVCLTTLMQCHSIKHG